MRRIFLLPFTFTVLVLAPRLNAQKMTNAQLTPGGTTALTHPLPASIVADDLRFRPSHDADTSILLQKGGSPAVGVPQPGPGMVISPNSNSVGFKGLSHRDQRLAGTGIYTNTQFSTEPPDQGLAAGNGFVVEAVNSALAVYDQHNGGMLLGPTPVNQFFQRSPEIIRSQLIYGDFLADPRVLYDQQTRRWLVTVVEIDTDPHTGAFGARSRLLLAVSKTDDPTLQWNIFSIDVTDDGSNGELHPGCPCFGDQPLIEIAVGCGYGVRAAIKRLMDITLGGVLTIVAAPIAALAALAVWLDDGRPVLIRQSRVGRGGVPFAMWKFRSMTMPLGGEGDGVGLTRVGGLLRRYRIDELPQLLNVIAGDMSLVGPRPERPEIVARILTDLPEFELRNLVREHPFDEVLVGPPPGPWLDARRRRCRDAASGRHGHGDGRERRGHGAPRSQWCAAPSMNQRRARSADGNASVP